MNSLRLIRLFALAAVVLGGSAAYLWWYDPPAKQAFVVASPKRELGELPLGASLVTFDITNQSDRPGRIIGLAEG
jgi:hypothetical protein